jgi:hypothetical protein
MPVELRDESESLKAVSDREQPIGLAKNKVGKSGKISALRLTPSSHHDSPHNHHESTSKLPSKNTRNSRTPLENTSKTAKNRTLAPGNFFVKFDLQKSSPHQE